MALITENLEIPPVAVLFPRTRRRHEKTLRPHGTAAAHRRHVRARKDDPSHEICAACRRWATLDKRLRRTQRQLAALAAKTGPVNSNLNHFGKRQPQAFYLRCSNEEFAELQYESHAAAIGAEPF